MYIVENFAYKSGTFSYLIPSIIAQVNTWFFILINTL